MRGLFAVVQPQQVGIAARQGKRGEVLPQLLRPVPVCRAVISVRLPSRDDLHHEVLLAQAEGGGVRSDARRRTVERVHKKHTVRRRFTRV